MPRPVDKTIIVRQALSRVGFWIRVDLFGFGDECGQQAPDLRVVFDQLDQFQLDELMLIVSVFSAPRNGKNNQRD